MRVNRTAIRYRVVRRADEDEIRAKVVELAAMYGRAGYRMIANMLRNHGILINHKRVERIWREEGLKRPRKQPKRRRLWLRDGSCIRLRPEHRNHVWSYDFVEDKTSNGRKLRFLNVIDEAMHECLASVPRRNWKSGDVIELLSGLMVERGCPEYIRSDNGPEFIANKLRAWLGEIGVITAYIEPGSPWENGYCESFNARMRDEFLNGEIFDTLREAEVLARRWKEYYNKVRPHSSLGGRPPGDRPKFCVNRKWW